MSAPARPPLHWATLLGLATTAWILVGGAILFVMSSLAGTMFQIVVGLDRAFGRVWAITVLAWGLVIPVLFAIARRVPDQRRQTLLVFVPILLLVLVAAFTLWEGGFDDLLFDPQPELFFR